MNALTVKDLDMSIELDHESAASIYGGNPSLQGTPYDVSKQRVDDEKAAKKAAESVYTTVAESTVYTTLAIVGSAI